MYIWSEIKKKKNKMGRISYLQGYLSAMLGPKRNIIGHSL